MIDRLFEVEVRYFPAEGEEPAVYLATNDELGLVVEAETYEDLTARVLDLVLDLYELNIQAKSAGDLSTQSSVAPAVLLRQLLRHNSHARAKVQRRSAG